MQKENGTVDWEENFKSFENAFNTVLTQEKKQEIIALFNRGIDKTLKPNNYNPMFLQERNHILQENEMHNFVVKNNFNANLQNTTQSHQSRLTNTMQEFQKIQEQHLHKQIQECVSKLYVQYYNKKHQVYVNIKKIIAIPPKSPLDIMKGIQIKQIDCTTITTKSKTLLKHINIKIQNKLLWRFDGKNFIDVK